MSEGEHLRHKGTLVPLYCLHHTTVLHFLQCHLSQNFVDFVSFWHNYNFFIAFAQLKLPAFIHFYHRRLYFAPGYAMVNAVIWNICVQPLLSPFYRTPDM